ncbi:3295_t:CDS:2, partial [Acaulospora morrowiae]
FGMLLWELAFERFPYKDMEMPEITEHVLTKKRESLDFPDGPQEITSGFSNIIVASWNHDPHLRPVIKDLFNDFTMLIDLHGKNSSEIELVTNITDPPSSIPDIKVTVIEDHNEDLYLTSLPQSLKPIIPLEEGINAHRSSERKKAWECFEIHAELGDPKAKYWMGYYLWEGHNGPKDPEKAKKLFKEAADAGVPDAQLRYAFAISKENFQDFIKYLIKAADNGNATAQYNMADMYLKGRLGVEKDEKKGLQYLRLAALKNQPKAIEALKHYDVNAIYV